MANEYLTVSNGIFTLSETKNKNQFYFYRNDGEVIGDIGNEPIDLVQAYLSRKMMDGEFTDMISKDIYFKKTEDGKCGVLTICEIGEKVKENNSNAEKKQANIFKRLFHKIFG